MQVNNLKFTLDPDYPDKIEIGIVEDGVVVEGGQFDLNAFMDVIVKFYNENY